MSLLISPCEHQLSLAIIIGVGVTVVNCFVSVHASNQSFLWTFRWPPPSTIARPPRSVFCGNSITDYMAFVVG